MVPLPQVDVVALQQVGRDGQVTGLPLEFKLELQQKLHFIYEDFLCSVIVPSGRFQPNSMELFDLEERVGAFLGEHYQQQVVSSMGCLFRFL